MPELRWILFAFGVVLLLGIYFWGRRNAKPTAAGGESPPWRPEPAFETMDSYEPPDEPADPGLDDVDQAPRTAIEGAQTATLIRRRARASNDASDEPTLEAPASSRADRDRRHARIEPTFTEESMTAELPAHEPAPAPQARPSSPATDAPTLSMSSTPPPRRIERRKIIALRLAAPQRIPGAELLAALAGESLAHGKYDVFHRLDEHGSAIFSIASMIEPGTFDLEKMPQETFPGITLFAQLPGPVAGMLAFDELIACSKRLHAALGGTLQDERGIPLTVHRIERMRQEIREFEQRPAADSTLRPTSTLSPSP